MTMFGRSRVMRTVVVMASSMLMMITADAQQEASSSDVSTTTTTTTSSSPISRDSSSSWWWWSSSSSVVDDENSSFGSSSSSSSTDAPFFASINRRSLSDNIFSDEESVVVGDPCSFCADGSSPANTNRTLNMLENSFGVILTCQQLEAYLYSTVKADDELCLQMRNLVGGYCGCPPIENHCTSYCETYTPNQTLPKMQEVLGLDFIPTCALLESMQYQLEKSNPFCRAGQSRRFYNCGCDEGYLNTKNDRQRAALFWVPIATGFLSFCGSSFIIYDILSQRKKKLQNTFSQIMLMISCFDLCNSIGWGTSTIFTPAYDEGVSDFPVYNSFGNDRTCTVQGFFIQLGYVPGIFYNGILCLYYVLVIVRGWKETHLKKIRKYLLGVPFVFGIILALAGIPFYESIIIGCHIARPPINDRWLEIILWGLAPACATIVFITIGMTTVYIKVRRDIGGSRRWRTTTGSDLNNKNKKASTTKSKKVPLEVRVMHQCIFYVFCCYISYTVIIVAQTKQEGLDYWFWLLVVMLAPMQGFNNMLVYVRPRILRALERRRHEQEEEEEEAKEGRKQGPNHKSEQPAVTIAITSISDASVNAFHPGGGGGGEEEPSFAANIITLEESGVGTSSNNDAIIRFSPREEEDGVNGVMNDEEDQPSSLEEDTYGGQRHRKRRFTNFLQMSTAYEDPDIKIARDDDEVLVRDDEEQKD